MGLKSSKKAKAKPRVVHGESFLIPAAVAGAYGVGKTSFIYRVSLPTSIAWNNLSNQMEQVHSGQPPHECKSKKVDIEGTTFRFLLRDTMGHEKFKDLTTAHYSGVLIIFLFFDITQLSSLYNLTTYMNESQSFTQELNPPYVLVGTKADLQSERTISESAIYEFMANNVSICQYIELSSKTNFNCDEALFIAASTIFQNLQEGKYSAELFTSLQTEEV